MKKKNQSSQIHKPIEHNHWSAEFIKTTLLLCKIFLIPIKIMHAHEFGSMSFITLYIYFWSNQSTKRFPSHLYFHLLAWCLFLSTWKRSVSTDKRYFFFFFNRSSSDVRCTVKKPELATVRSLFHSNPDGQGAATSILEKKKKKKKNTRLAPTYFFTCAFLIVIFDSPEDGSKKRNVVFAKVKVKY